MDTMINIKLKYKEMYNKFILYCYEMNFSKSDDWDEEAKAMWDEIKSFEAFCKIFFNININNTFSQA